MSQLPAPPPKSFFMGELATSGMVHGTPGIKWINNELQVQALMPDGMVITVVVRPINLNMATHVHSKADDAYLPTDQVHGSLKPPPSTQTSPSHALPEPWAPPPRRALQFRLPGTGIKASIGWLDQSIHVTEGSSWLRILVDDKNWELLEKTAAR